MWFKVDDQLAFNSKIVLAGNDAMGLWVRAGSWCASQLRGGFVPFAMAHAIAKPMANGSDIAALVACGLWDEVDGGYEFHDWDEYQPSAEDTARRREMRSKAGKKGAEARWGHGKSYGTSHSKPMASAIANDMAKECPVPVPVPKEEQEASPLVARSPRGSRINAEWQPSEKCHNDLGAEYIDLNLPLELDAFRDHWLSKGETRKDWDAAFRNWCRNARKYASKSTPAKRTTNGLTDDQWQAAFERAQAADRAAGVLA